MNLPPAKLFMGDAGSMMIGFIVAVLTLVASVNTENQLSAPVPLLLLGVPFLDTTLAFLRRFLKGKSWRDADREHVHHRLLDRGLSPSELLIALGSVSLLFATVGVFLGGQQSDVSVLFFATLTFAVLVSTRVIGEVEMSLIKKIFSTQKKLDEVELKVVTDRRVMSETDYYKELHANLDSLDIGDFALWKISAMQTSTGNFSSTNFIFIACLDDEKNMVEETQPSKAAAASMSVVSQAEAYGTYKIYKLPDLLYESRSNKAA